MRSSLKHRLEDNTKEDYKISEVLFQVLILPFLDQREIFLEAEKWNVKAQFHLFWRLSHLVFPTSVPGNRLESEGLSHEYIYYTSE